MSQQAISLQPQIIQFNSDSQQMIKIVNRSGSKIKNCFFCLFNTSKYQFRPQSFDLDPHQQKIIVVTILHKNNSKPKEFAYVKSKVFSKRITLLNYDAQTSQNKFRSPASDVDDIYTLSSRDYRESQKVAYDRIIAEKQAYIKRLERKIQDQDITGRQNHSFTSDRKKQNAFTKQIDSLQTKLQEVKNQKRLLELENIKLNQKVQQFKNNVSVQTHAQQAKLLQQNIKLKQKQLEKLKADFVFLEAECQSLFQIISQKENIIQNLHNKNEQIVRQSQNKYEKIIYDLKNQNRKLQSQHKQSKLQTKNLQRKFNEIQKLYCSEEKYLKNKNDSDQYNNCVQIALQCCKNQNQILKKNIVEANHNLIQQSKIKSNYQNKVKLLENEINELNEQIKSLKYEKEQYSVRQKISRNESHQTIIKLRSQNIDLIQKIGIAEDTDTKSLTKEIKQLKQKLSLLETNLKQQKCQKQKCNIKMHQAEQTVQKLTKKLFKYKNETKKQLQDLTCSTLDQLKRTKLQKKQLKQQITQLSKTIQEQKQKYKSVLHLGQNLNRSYQKQQAQTKYNASKSDRRIGIKNQRKHIQDSLSLSKNQISHDHLFSELGQLRQFKNYIEIEMKKIKNRLNFELYSQSQNNFSLFSFFNDLQFMCSKINEQQISEQQLNDAIKQIQYLKGRICELENSKNYHLQIKQQQSFAIINAKKLSQHQSILQAVKDQMKNQYRKLMQSLKLSQEKFELLKKNIYQEYRTKLYTVLNGKQSNARNQYQAKISKIEHTLQRFVENIANRSHKQAMISKQIQSIQKLKKDNTILRQKVNNLNNMLETKQGYCTRDALKVFHCSNEPEWHDNIQLEAKMLTFQAENIRLNEQNRLMLMQNKSFEQQVKICLVQLETKQKQIDNLKRQIIDIKNQNEKQLLQRQKDIQQLQKKFIKEKNQQNNKNSSNDKQYSQMKQDIKRKKQIIQNLRQKEKMLEQIIQSSNRSNQTNSSKYKRQFADQTRYYESIHEFKQNNRMLRIENSKLKQEIILLKQQNEKKSSAYKRMKMENESSRMKGCKHEQIQIEKINLQVAQLKSELKKQKNLINKMNLKRQKQNLQFESELQRVKNQFLIQKSSLESIIRSLSDNICRLYSDLQIICKKKGCFIERAIDFQQLLSNCIEIDSGKVYDSFDQLLNFIKT